jgi:hypothetical protein
LNSNCWAVGGCGPGSAQHRWLAERLAARRGPCLLAYWHHPLFSAGRYTGREELRPWWELLYQHGAALVLTAHDHNYQRLPPLDPQGQPGARGVRQFVVGTGGRNLYRARGGVFPRPEGPARRPIWGPASALAPGPLRVDLRHHRGYRPGPRGGPLPLNRDPVSPTGAASRFLEPVPGTRGGTLRALPCPCGVFLGSAQTSDLCPRCRERLPGTGSRYAVDSQPARLGHLGACVVFPFPRGS